MAVAAAALGASGTALAQSGTAPRVSPPAVYQVAPPMGRYTDEVLFGEVWRREGLSPRDRSLLVVSTLIANGRAAQLRGHVGRALDNGVKPAEIAEIVTHLAFYAGWPVAVSSVQEIKAVFDQRKIETPDFGAEPLPVDAAAEARRKADLQATAGAAAPPLAELTDRVLFADLWRRPDLTPRDRSLVTIAALIANGASEQLPFYVNRAMDAGLTAAQLSEAVTHLAFYAGWPRAMSAVPVVQKILADRTAPPAATGLRLQRHAAGATTTGPAANFTGTVRVASRFQAESPARVGGGLVSFEPGARTAWHTHPLGQTLVVTAGCGRVQAEGGPVEVIRPGDVVWIPPGVRHWHGAAPDTAMSHLAVAEASEGVSVRWMEQVSDQQYDGAAGNAGRCGG
ncbi:carboxymuconolactone decarboxylase family protein [Roseomonas sp. 18066]|uniref:(R)-mandelonitrile lyase n=1 Tax=Roseomonas sp. 18066 TaxID=2681412 RepID=UPI0034CF1A50